MFILSQSKLCVWSKNFFHKSCSVWLPNKGNVIKSQGYRVIWSQNVHFVSTQFNSTQLNSTQLYSTLLNSTQPIFILKASLKKLFQQILNWDYLLLVIWLDGHDRYWSFTQPIPQLVLLSKAHTHNFLPFSLWRPGRLVPGISH